MLVSTGASAVIAAVVSSAFNFAFGGWMEIRKRRAVRRDDVHAEIENGVRVILNALRTVRQPGMPWRAEGLKVTGFDDGFDEAFTEIEESYRSIRTHLAGQEDANLERTIGYAINLAGRLTRQVKDFRDGAIGRRPEGLEKERDAMTADLSTAKAALEMARDCLQATGLRRRWRRRRLSKYMQSDPVAVIRTPRFYAASLPPDSDLTPS